MASDAERIVLEAFAAVDSRDNERLGRICHPEVRFLWPESLKAKGFGAGSWDELWAPFQPADQFPTRGMEPQLVASNGNRVVVRWHQRGINKKNERADFEVLGLYDVRDGLLYRAQMFYFDTAAVRRFLESQNG